MSSPIGAINFLLGKVSKRKHDDHWSDRLYYVAVPYFLLFLAGLQGLKQYFGKPVEVNKLGEYHYNLPSFAQCFPPAEMARKGWMDYAEGLCFVEDTYYVAMNEQLPMERVDRQQRQIHYYQSVLGLICIMVCHFKDGCHFCWLGKHCFLSSQKCFGWPSGSKLVIIDEAKLIIT